MESIDLNKEMESIDLNKEMESIDLNRNIELLDLNRNMVLNDYQNAIIKNKKLFIKGDIKANSEYIFDNQKQDASTICKMFYEENKRVISILKRTKVGMDGLMIEIAKNMATHPDNNFCLLMENIFFITGMSNKSWEDDMKDKIPTCFKENVYHHGKLQGLKMKISNIKNAIIIIDEIDTGDKEDQKLHSILKDSNVLDIKYMEDNNIRFIFVSATMINELRNLYKWGDKHYIHQMTIPDTYIGHNEFLELGIIQEFYPIEDDTSADKWVQEDILQKYEADFRVHIIRTDEKNKDFIHNACIRNGIDFKNHTSNEKIEHDELTVIFNNIVKHVVIAVKGFYRRANLIPNEWKKKIGATHEKYVRKFDTNVQVQGLPGRMTGYWKTDIINGHKTGPHRTSIQAINQYETFYNDPFTTMKYNTSSSSNKLFVNPKNIKNIEVLSPTTCKYIPIVIDGLNENDEIFTLTKKKDKIFWILTKIKNDPTYDKLHDFILNPNVSCLQISTPKSKMSYKKHITDIVNASCNDAQYIIDLDETKKDKCNWQMFVDDKLYRLCFVLWTNGEIVY